MASPNFLVFVTDQHRADHLGCYGNRVVQTPHIDRLARRGWRFERTYVANPVCMPNRGAMMTGRMPSVHGARGNGVPLPLQSVTWADVLADFGYRTALIGKSHLQTMDKRPSALPDAAPVTPAKAISETAAASTHSMPHRLAHHPMHGMALAAAMPVHSMSHSKLLHAIRCV